MEEETILRVLDSYIFSISFSSLTFLLFPKLQRFLHILEYWIRVRRSSSSSSSCTSYFLFLFLVFTCKLLQTFAICCFAVFSCYEFSYFSFFFPLFSSPTFYQYSPFILSLLSLLFSFSLHCLFSRVFLVHLINSISHILPHLWSSIFLFTFSLWLTINNYPRFPLSLIGPFLLPLVSFLYVLPSWLPTVFLLIPEVWVSRCTTH